MLEWPHIKLGEGNFNVFVTTFHHVLTLLEGTRICWSIVEYFAVTSMDAEESWFWLYCSNIENCEIEHIQSWGKLIPMYFEILLSNSRPCQVSVGCAKALQRQYFTVSSNKELILATFRVGLSLLVLFQFPFKNLVPQDPHNLISLFSYTPPSVTSQSLWFPKWLQYHQTTTSVDITHNRLYRLNLQSLVSEPRVQTPFGNYIIPC